MEHLDLGLYLGGDKPSSDVLVVLVAGVGSGLYDEIADAPVPCERLGGVGSLLLGVLVALEALALEPCIGYLSVLVLGRGLAVVV